MGIDLQVKFESMKIQTTLHKNIPHMSFGGLDLEAVPAASQAPAKVMRRAGTSQRASFTCKTSQYVNMSVRLAQLVSNTCGAERNRSQSQLGARLVFWKSDTYPPCLDNNLQICCLTEYTRSSP